MSEGGNVVCDLCYQSMNEDEYLRYEGTNWFCYEGTNWFCYRILGDYLDICPKCIRVNSKACKDILSVAKDWWSNE